MLSKSAASRRLWLVSVAAIAVILTVGIAVNRLTLNHAPSPLAARLVAIVAVTVLVAVAKLTVGPRAAAVAGILGTLIAVVVLLNIG